ncbi:hypothetical protein LEP1GSC195_1590 [Leptospira wolbachii serovar Codice str. CDC]|uniref:Uncharacterized protein n=2 Tax=Leptospira TaxID=171 RepID=R9A660_9LEPT|nr:hypothetical protein LEP1GSC195_1590 [Leptospira wolbachii serovar Codice str. CDC]
MASFEKWGTTTKNRGNLFLQTKLTNLTTFEVQNLGLGKTKNLFRSSHAKTPSFLENQEIQISLSKPKTLSRWVSWTNHQSNSKTMEVADLKPIWNYLLGETGFSDLFSYIHPDKEKSLQMVVEPKNKGLVLYVFWDSKDTGAMGIQFHYDPEKDKPILVEITTEQSIQGEEFSKQLFALIREFPQIQAVQIETWSESTFNGDYR